MRKNHSHQLKIFPLMRISKLWLQMFMSNLWDNTNHTRKRPRSQQRFSDYNTKTNNPPLFFTSFHSPWSLSSLFLFFSFCQPKKANSSPPLFYLEAIFFNSPSFLCCQPRKKNPLIIFTWLLYSRLKVFVRPRLAADFEGYVCSMATKTSAGPWWGDLMLMEQ